MASSVAATAVEEDIDPPDEAFECLSVGGKLDERDFFQDTEFLPMYQSVEASEVEPAVEESEGGATETGLRAEIAEKGLETSSASISGEGAGSIEHSGAAPTLVSPTTEHGEEETAGGQHSSMLTSRSLGSEGLEALPSTSGDAPRVSQVRSRPGTMISEADHEQRHLAFTEERPSSAGRSRGSKLERKGTHGRSYSPESRSGNVTPATSRGSRRKLERSGSHQSHHGSSSYRDGTGAESTYRRKKEGTEGMEPHKTHRREHGSSSGRHSGSRTRGHSRSPELGDDACTGASVTGSVHSEGRRAMLKKSKSKGSKNRLSHAGSAKGRRLLLAPDGTTGSPKKFTLKLDNPPPPADEVAMAEKTKESPHLEDGANGAAHVTPTKPRGEADTDRGMEPQADDQLTPISGSPRSSEGSGLRDMSATTPVPSSDRMVLGRPERAGSEPMVNGVESHSMPPLLDIKAMPSRSRKASDSEIVPLDEIHLFSGRKSASSSVASSHKVHVDSPLSLSSTATQASADDSLAVPSIVASVLAPQGSLPGPQSPPDAMGSSARNSVLASGRRDSNATKQIMLSKLRGKIKEVLKKNTEDGPSVPSTARSPEKGTVQGEPDMSRRPSQVDGHGDHRRNRRRNHNTKIKISEDMLGKIMKRASASKPARGGILSPVSASRAVVVQSAGPEIEEMVESYVEVVCDEDFAKKGTRRRRKQALAPLGVSVLTPHTYVN